MARAGLVEESFSRLADLSTFGRFKRLSQLELWLWRGLHCAGLPYPEACLLGTYRRPPAE
jgi:hypothetical protein